MRWWYALALIGCAEEAEDRLECADVATAEVCDGYDNDCDGLVDEIFDLDGDGFLADEAACRAMGVETDCDDTDPDIYPGAVEHCDGIDRDCSGLPDDAGDQDGDGYDACEECDDSNAAVFPGAVEACDGIDNDCSGGVDEIWDADGDGSAGCFDDCDDADPLRAPHIPEACDGQDNDCDLGIDEGFDEDQDGWTSCAGDCDDGDAGVHPLAEEACDGIDNDCNPDTREDDDLDRDGWVICDGDCDDGDPETHPDAAEDCDWVDNDCDGYQDELPECHDCVEDGDDLFCLAPLAWNDAQTACEGMGGTLAILDEAGRNDAVAAAAAEHIAGSVWIGLNDQAREDDWLWSDGTEADWFSWADYQPDNWEDSEHCVNMNWKVLGQWNDATCDWDQPFVCEL